MMIKTAETDRAEILMHFLRVLAVIGAIAYVPSMYFSVLERLWSIAIVDTAAFALVMLAAYLPGLSANVRLSFFVGCILSVAVVVLMVAGPEGAGYLWFLCAALVAALFGDRAAAFVVIGLSLIAMVAYACLLDAGVLDFDVSPSSALIIAANLSAISLGFAFIIRELVGRQEAALSIRERLTHELHHRVKNNMQVALSIVSLEANSGSDSSGVRAIERRMRVLASANDMILEHPLEASLGFSELARLLADSATAGYCANDAENLSDDLLRLDASNAVTFAVGASELLVLMQTDGSSVTIAASVEGTTGRIILRFPEDVPFGKITQAETALFRDPFADILLNSASVRAFPGDGEGGPGFELKPLVPLRLLVSLPDREGSGSGLSFGSVPKARSPVL